MFETVVIATDGSESTKRGIRTALDVASRFDATVHAVYVIDENEIAASPEEVRDQLHDAIESTGEDALATVRDEAAQQGDMEVVTAVREGSPASELIEYGEAVGADVIAMGTRGRHGEHAYLLGSVAEAVVRRSPIPVLTVRQLE
ncbi:universal stress protein [Halovenus rubra]|uniref:Universal stress protein n=2 Tax=Halovenus rubra TaxID=869890 RepID=A0ACC7E2R7_9EURY|nr:universal stress protein [Halovenus rubra]